MNAKEHEWERRGGSWIVDRGSKKKPLLLFQRFSVLVFKHLPIRPADFFLKPLIFGLFSSHG
jgi:hypothetical protein